MKKSVSTDSIGLDSGTGTENIIVNTPKKMLNHKIENKSGNSVMCEEVARQIKT